MLLLSAGVFALSIKALSCVFAVGEAMAGGVQGVVQDSQLFDDQVWKLLVSVLVSAVAVLAWWVWRLLRSLRHARAARAESEQRFWQVLEHLPVVLVIHRQGIIQYINTFTLKLIGYAHTRDVVGKPISDFLHPDDSAEVRALAESIEQTGAPACGLPVRYITPKGERKQHEMIANRTRIMLEGEPATLTIALDVTRQNHIIQELKQQHHMLEVILSSSPVGVWMRDAKGKLQFVNDAYAHMIGVDKEALLEAEDDYALVGEDTAHTRKSSDMICRTSGTLHHSSEFYVTRQGDEMVCEVIKVPLFDEGHYQGLVGFSLDVTKRVQAEIEKTEIQRKALETQHLESLGVLSGGIAHDFNNLLAVIMGNAGLMRKRLTPNTEEQIFMQRIEETCQKAASLCQQMLTYAGKSVLSSKPIQVSSLVHDMGSLLEVSLSKKVSIRYDLALDVPCFEGDEAQIQQLVLNLITNANEAMQEQGGNITLRTFAASADVLEQKVDGLRVCVGAFKPANYVCLEVQDHGCGMDEATQQRIFEPFFTTKFTGRGLGMSAMLGTVQGHDGVIAMKSNPGQGTLFRVFFPVKDMHEPAASPAPTEKTAQTHAERRGKVLIVDDERILLETAQAMLEDLGYETFLAEDGEQAVSIYQAKQHEIQTVLLDMTMPKMDGKACAEALLKLNPNLKIIIASGYAEDDIYKQFKGMKLAGIVQKPYDFERLQEVMF